MTKVIHVCIPGTNRDFFDYSVDDKNPVPGSRVLVPFGKKTRLGIVIREGLNNSGITIKPITDIIDNKPLVPECMLKLCTWIANYYQAPLASVISLALPKNLRLGKPLLTITPTKIFRLTTNIDDAHQRLKKNAAKQHALIDYINAQPAAPKKSEILNAGFTSSQLKALVDNNLLASAEQNQTKELSMPLPLNSEQNNAVKIISESLNAYKCFLLKGVTGSGKTEVYLHVIAKVLNSNRQVLVLVPEIGLTPQLLSRFTSRFAEQIVVVHSNLSDGERQLAWQNAYSGHARLIIGTRGAIFTPLPDLGLIIIDEEHDASFKQMDRVRYNARDTALIRANSSNIPIILGTATPSLESLHNSLCGKYTLLTLSKRAISTIPLRYQLLDIRSTYLLDGLAPLTIETIREHLERGHQVLVFINRRGFSPVLLCHKCGFMFDCKHCDSHLTLHRKLGKLICHHCGLMQAIPSACKNCKSTELLPLGSGTQRIYERLSKEFPKTSCVRIDRDTVQKKHALSDALSQIDTGATQLIIGTQMLAKGHHFPRLTLVVILDADAGFYNQDFRAIENLGQLITQVAGRAGRAELAGHVMIQTHLPQHPLLNTLIQKGYDAFSESLLESRAQAKLPPYHYIAAIRAQGPKLENVLQFLHTVKQLLQTAQLDIMGPAPAPLARKGGNHHMQLLLKSSSRIALQKILTNMRSTITLKKIDRNIRWNIDVDPQDLS